MTMDRVGRTTALIRSLGKDRVLVGIPAENALRKPEPGEDPGVNNAMLGFVHENGSPAKNIPARPFLIPGVQDAREEIGKRLESSARATLSGKTTDADRTLNAVGLIAVNAVRKRIVDGPFTPLKPKTLAARRRKGRTGTKPLIDTGQLKGAITYVVRDQK
jgi:hypothetical protein